MTTGDLIIGALLLLAGNKARAATSTASKEKKAADALSRIGGLQARANQKTAAAWIPDLIAAGATDTEARALARWIGIESSGMPLTPSPAGEYGLLQITPTTAKEVLTPDERMKMKEPTTSRADHAAIAMKQYRWHLARAKQYVRNWPGDSSPDAVFWAKMHHARPADLSKAKPDGSNTAAAARALIKGTDDPNLLLRLGAASVVRYNTVEVPPP